MSIARRCQECDAPTVSGDGDFCRFCGAELPPRSFVDAAGRPDRAALLGAVRDRKSVTPWNRRRLWPVPAGLPVPKPRPETPDPGLVAAGCGSLFAVLLVFVGGLAFVAHLEGHTFGIPWNVLIYILAPVGGVVILALAGTVLLGTPRGPGPRSEPRAPDEDPRVPFLILDRNPVNPGQPNARERVLVEDEKGARRTFEVARGRMDHLAAGDVGLAYIEGSAMRLFQRIKL